MNRKPPSVCFIAQELPQFVKNGGAGTATQGFAEALAEAGCEVSILFVGPVEVDNYQLVKFIAELFSKKIQFHILKREGNNVFYDVYLWLKSRRFDFMHFYDYGGYGFYVTQAKLAGVAFKDSVIISYMHGSTRWASEITEWFWTDLTLEVDFLERSTMRFSDVVMSPSRYMFRYMDSTGWKSSAQRIIQRAVLPYLGLKPEGDNEPVGVDRRHRKSKPMHEIIFFGRHEIRKGFLIFIDAVHRLLEERKDIRVTFLGKEGPIYGVNSQEFAEARLEQFLDRVEFFSPPDRRDLVGRLTAPNVLAVIPSVDENLPNTVFESTLWGVNFIASNVGGIPELLDAPSAEKRLFTPTVDGLVAKIEQMLSNFVEPAGLAFNPQAEREKFIDWHFENRATAPRKLKPPRPPTVSVCVAHHERPSFLRQALNSLLDQTYEFMNIIVVDDGSSSADALAKLKVLKEQFGPKGVEFFHTQDVGPGAARNFAASKSKSDYIFFFDDDNIACPNMVETFINAAVSSGIDIITGFNYVFSSAEPPNKDMEHYPRWFPLGSAVNIGIFRNSFGDSQSLWKKSIFTALGGFSEAKIPSEDWELFSRASLSGHDIVIIPEQLHWRRNHKRSLSSRPYSQWKNYTQIADNYAKKPPPDLNLILRVAQRYVPFAGGFPARSKSGSI